MPIMYKKEECCGCMACYNICPQNAISMEVDDKGFIYPTIQKEKCVNCNLCENVCDFRNLKRDDSFPISAHLLIHKNKNVLMNSTSGGAFTALSDVVLGDGGIIVGASLNKDLTVSHSIATTKEQRDIMRGSLYVQSTIGNTYKIIEEELNDEKKVMFVGTPCQVGGLLQYLGRGYENLITVEFLCHGVPNNIFFKEHIRFLEEKYKKIGARYTFRDKKFAWWTHGIEEITFEDGSKKSSHIVQAYSHFFQSYVSVRPSCLKCTYRKKSRRADVLIADFWGIKKITGRNDRKGASLVLINTEKGKSLFERIKKDDVYFQEIPYKTVDYRIINTPPKATINPEKFWQVYIQNGYDGILKEYYNKKAIERVKYKIKKIFRLFLGSK